MLIQLQYVRAVAALLVVYFHSVLQLQRLDSDAVFSGLLFGEKGVDLFFVLSGFVMWLTTADRQVGPLDFYRRRIERIVPVYWLFTLAAAGIALVLPSYLKSTLFDLPHLMASLFFIPWTNAADPTGVLIAPVVIPGWTLNYEMYFYLIFGALLVLPKNARIPALGLLFAGLYWLFNSGPVEGVAARFYGNPIIFEFLGGVVLAWLYLGKRLLPAGAAIPLVPLAFAGLVILDLVHLDLPRLVSAGIPSLLLVYALVSIDFSKVREFRILHLIGDASYSLYLSHVFTLVAVRVVYGFLPFAWMKHELIFIFSCLIGSVIVSFIVYRCFEAPVAGMFKETRKSQKTAAGLSGGKESA